MDLTEASTTFWEITGFRLSSVLDYIKSFPSLFVGLFIHLVESLLPITLVVMAISGILYIAGRAWRFFHH